MNISKILKHTEKFVGDNSPAILTGIGVAGTVATALLTAKASFKAYERLRDLEREDWYLDVGPDKKEQFKLVWTLYIPPVLTGCVTITSIILANRIGTRRAAALASAYAISERAYSEYREKIVEKLGEKKEESARAEIAQKTVNDNPNTSVVINSESEALFYDNFSGRYFKSTMEEVKKAQNDTNYDILNTGYASLNEFYQRLGLPFTTMGEELGWNANDAADKINIEFSAVLNEHSKPVAVIDFVKVPVRTYYRMG